VVVPPARRPWRRRVSRRAAGKGWCTRRRLEGLYTRVLSYFSGKRGRTLRGTARKGETAVCPAVRRGARPVGSARRATGSWREGGGFPRASVRERPREGARTSGRRALLGKARGRPGRRGGGAWRGRRGRRGVTSCSGAKTFHCALVHLRFPPDFEIEVHQSVNREVVDLTTLYNFHKGSRVFFSTDFAGTSCQL
jgi:hypothetical protein